MEAIATILYREIEGCGNDVEANQPNGAVVTLTHWTSLDGDWRVEEHYLLREQLVIDRELIQDSTSLMRAVHFRQQADVIRKAIKAMDALVVRLDR